MPLSKHGELRIRKRLGIPRKAADKLAKQAWTNGHKPSEFTGRFKKYLLYEARTYRSVVKVHKGNIFFFGSDGVLITCWTVPAKFRKQLKDRIHDTDNSD